MTEPRDARPTGGPDDEAEGLAAEYVVGTLPLAERLAAENLARTNPGFAARITDWENKLAPFNAAYPEVQAPNVLPRVEARLFGTTATQRTGMFGWLRGALAGAAVAAALVVGALYLIPGAPPAPGLTATLTAADQTLAFAAVYDAGTSALTVTRTGGPDADPGRSYELWVIVGEAAPVSLGVVDQAAVTRQLAALEPGAVLAISLEPAGGSPSGAPTGPVLVTGVVSAL